MDEEIIIGGIYTHFKGMNYRVLNIAKHSETLEDFVVYEALYNNPEGKIWIRPKSMFLEKIKIDDKNISRFEIKST